MCEACMRAIAVRCIAWMDPYVCEGTIKSSRHLSWRVNARKRLSWSCQADSCQVMSCGSRNSARPSEGWPFRNLIIELHMSMAAVMPAVNTNRAAQPASAIHTCS